mgnify:CR=1 FL=1
MFGGVASDLSALITENCFEYLDAPVQTLGASNLPAIPLNVDLEKQMLPNAEKVEEALKELLDY